MKRCMIVDDSSVIRKVAARILAGPEMEVHEAEDAASGLTLCRAVRPDIIVVDSILPDTPSDAFIREIFAIDPEYRPHVVLCMSQLDVGIYMRAKRAGARGYILKPFDRAQLLEQFRDMKVAA